MKFSARVWLLVCLGCLCLGGRRTALAQSDAGRHALALEQQGESAEAEQAWRAILLAKPHNAEALAHIGLLEARQNHYNAAITYYRKAIAIDPKFPGLETDLGLALFKTSQFPAAAQAFQAALRAAPADQRLTILIGMAYYGAARYAHAIPYLRRAAQNDPSSLPLRLTLAHSCLWAKQFPCVLTVYKQILLLNAESAEADMLAGEAMDAMGNVTGAITQFRSAERVNPKEPNVHFGLGYLLWTQKQYSEAQKEFQAELDNNPKHGKARAYLGDTLVRQNDYARAEPELKKSIADEPMFALPYLDLGIIEAASGRNQDAVREFKKVIALEPKDVDSHWRLARLYQTMGKREEARAEFARVSAMKRQQDKSSRPNILSIP
ncbi:MAG: tetratricopeptide repeat protein [Acidobacteriaceae bacterium]